jgi:hypothetical protein
VASSWFTRKRLDVREVHDLLHAQARMLENWAETRPDSPERRELWRSLHRAGDELAYLVYGGPTLRTRFSYWLRPFDDKADRRRWRWQESQCSKDRHLLDDPWTQVPPGGWRNRG